MNALAGTGALVRLALRLDRIRLPIWILAIAGTVVATASSFEQLYPTVASRLQLSSGIVENPSMRAIYGPLFDPRSIGGLTAWRQGGVGLVLIALMSLLTVVRHTRAEEEAGRLELIGAGVVGRYAPLTAALVLAFGASLLIGLLMAGGLIGLGLPTAGSLALGLGFLAVGWIFAAVAAVAAQLTESARLATGIAVSVLAAAYLVRAAGDAAADTGPTWLTWLSPIGWAQQIRPYAGERWEVFGLAAGLVVVCTGAAYTLVTRRDIGASLMPPRPGPSSASPGLRSALALAWRLQRAPLLGWTIGFAVMGTAMGAVADGVRDVVESSPQIEEIVRRIGGSDAIVDAFLATIAGLFGLVAAVYAVQATLRLRVEETGLRAEPLLATRVGRTEWVSSHVVLAALGAGVLLAVAGAGVGLTHGLSAGDVSGQLPRMVGGALVQLPATLVFAAVALALFGVFPRLTVLSWAALVVCLLIGQLGPLLQLDQRLMDLSPFTHVPQIPGSNMTWTPLLWLTAVALGLTAAGMVGFRRRDLS